MDIEIIGYDVYEEKFDMLVLPEYRGSAEEYLIKSIEGYFEPEYEINYMVDVESEKTKMQMDLWFYFVYSCEERSLKFNSANINAYEYARNRDYPLCRSFSCCDLDAYFKDFEEMIKQEYVGDAVDLLTEEIENIDIKDCSFSVCIDVEKSKNGKSIVFAFLFEIDEDEYGYDYSIKYMGCHEE